MKNEFNDEIAILNYVDWTNDIELRDDFYFIEKSLKRLLFLLKDLKITCDCGSKLRNNYYNGDEDCWGSHHSTKKHKQFEESQLFAVIDPYFDDVLYSDLKKYFYEFVFEYLK